jgi:hypothetical protein
MRPQSDVEVPEVCSNLSELVYLLLEFARAKLS